MPATVSVQFEGRIFFVVLFVCLVSLCPQTSMPFCIAIKKIAWLRLCNFLFFAYLVISLTMLDNVLFFWYIFLI